MADKVEISASLWGYAKPILVAGITRGLLGVSAFLIGHGLPGIPTDTNAALGVLACGVSVAAWAWGPIKSYADHNLKVKAADPASSTTLVLK